MRRRGLQTAILGTLLIACHGPEDSHRPEPPTDQASATHLQSAPQPRPQRHGAKAPQGIKNHTAPFNFTEVFDRVSPSTVGVAAGHPGTRGFVVRQSGSGFVWDQNDHIVTNAHLVAESNRIRIRTKDGRVLKAHLVGLDIGTDLAVLKVEGLSLPSLPRASTNDVRPGQWVAAIGNPYGMDHSITVGVVSAIRRRNLPGGAAKYAEFIQSDASIFPGNSGGPLVNTAGEIIGLNTATLGGGLSFSTRIDMVETVTRRIIERGRFDRGFAGLYVKHVSHSAAETAGLETPRGARVRGVVQGGPADKAGLRPGDIILEFDSREIDDSTTLPWLIAATPPGDAPELEVARGKARLKVRLNVAASPSIP